jgi:citrate lyase subunit beta/citryl-CoA lyase
VLPKAISARDIVQVANYLAALEAREGKPPGSTGLIAITTETPQALLNLNGYQDVLAAHPDARSRLAGLTWGSEDLSASMGVSRKTDQHGIATFTFQLARSLCVIASTAIGVQAIDGVWVDFRDAAGLTREVDIARRDGFTGKLAIHPDQVAPINAAFIPGADEIAWAKRVVAAFAQAPQAGVLSLEGQMIDRPHLVHAQRMLALQARHSG